MFLRPSSPRFTSPSMTLHTILRPLRGGAIRALALLAALCLAVPATAQPRAKEPPQRVWTGMYVLDLNGFDLRSGTYTADFYLWMRTEGPRDATNFEVMNGAGEPCVAAKRKQLGRVRYAAFRCRYEFHHSFDVADYPLDRHELTIELEDSELTEGELVYVPDEETTGLDPAVSLAGWTLGKPRVRVRTHAYSALGDPTRPPGASAPYSRLVLAIPLERGGASIYLKSFLVLFLSVGVGLLGSALECQHVEARLGLGVASIFGVVSSYMVVSQALPENSQFTLADQLHLVGMGVVFVSILVSVMVYRMGARVGEERAERVDRRLGWVTTSMFVAAVLAVTFLR